MSKSINRIMTALSALGLAFSCMTLGTAQDTPSYPQSSTFKLTRRVLEVFYPELFGNKWHVNFSASQPVEDNPWGDFFGCEFKVKRFSPDTSFSPLYDARAGKMAPEPENPTFLEGSSWIGHHGEMIRFLVNGSLAHSQQNGAIRKLVESHPEWSEEQDIAALKKAGADYGPDNKEKFIGSLHLERAEKVLGQLKIEFVEFQALANPQHDGSFASLFWVVHAEVQLPDGTHGRYAFGFEPFGGKLTGLSFIPNSAAPKEH